MCSENHCFGEMLKLARIIISFLLGSEGDKNNFHGVCSSLPFFELKHVTYMISRAYPWRQQFFRAGLRAVGLWVWLSKPLPPNLSQCFAGQLIILGPIFQAIRITGPSMEKETHFKMKEWTNTVGSAQNESWNSHMLCMAAQSRRRPALAFDEINQSITELPGCFWLLFLCTSPTFQVDMI